MGAGAERGRVLLQSRSDLLAASVAPRSRAAKSEEQQIDARHLFAALAAAAEPAGHLDRQAGRHRGQHGSGPRPRLPRRAAAGRFETRSLRVLAAGAGACRGFRGRVAGFAVLVIPGRCEASNPESRFRVWLAHHAGGSSATPWWRGITCMWRWNTTCPPAGSLNCWTVMPSALKAAVAARAILWAPRATWA